MPGPTASASSSAQQAWRPIWPVHFAANTTLPVIGIPMKGGAMDGLDALLATVQMPSGIPVATVALNGAKNAAWLAAEILALGDEALAAKLDAERAAMARQIAAKEEKLQGKRTRNCNV